MKAIADTGLIVAFGNRTDRFHSWAVEIARNIQVNAAPFLYRPGGPTEFSPRRKKL
jgi:predicted nucleic acid-binding protein